MTARDRFVAAILVGMVAAATVVAIALGTAERTQLPDFGGTYTEAVVGQPRVLNPLFAVTRADRDVSALLFTGLTRLDQRRDVVADLAREFSVAQDGKTWTFALRDDVRWHDGRPVSSDDVLYTVGLTQDRAYRGPYAGTFAGVRVDRVDERTVRFVLPDVYAPFAEATAIPILPVHALGGAGAAEVAAHPFGARPIGTGPFRLESRDEQRVVLARNEHFYRSAPERSRPYLDRIVLRLYPDAASAIAAIARNEVQGIGGLVPAEADRARRARSLAVHYLPSDELTVLFFNLAPDRPLFRERAVRQAIAYSIDRPRILQLAAGGHGALADAPVPPTSWAFPRELRRYERSPAEARRLLDAAGWGDRDRDGVRQKGTMALRFSILTHDDPARVATAEEISRDLLEVGIGGTVEVVSFGALVETRARQRAFDAMLIAIPVGSDPDPYVFWHSSQVQDPGRNFTSYHTLASDRALESARRTLDQTKRAELYGQVFHQLADDVPAVFLHFTDYVYVIDRVVKGVRIAPVEDAAHRFWNVSDWYLRTRPAEEAGG